MAFLSEAEVEQLLGLGYTAVSDEIIGPDGKQAERESHDEVVLKKRFEDAVARLNPRLPLEARWIQNRRPYALVFRQRESPASAHWRT